MKSLKIQGRYFFSHKGTSLVEIKVGVKGVGTFFSFPYQTRVKLPIQLLVEISTDNKWMVTSSFVLIIFLDKINASSTPLESMMSGLLKT